ncbi:hypothetical protein H6G06_12690 [Anabaena sphaerica FACHB-251]|uniref:Uncharacterized protein n=1 Tax=Anabaena sphaerica FACHB-251 TaxID=2692883 RepID=A0A927A172_9NOST|nr:hypothetical protein [Anabaena sphaerica]MBD2294319.1 hypothetical protein [Anabaena sphaerica FACHB-251]
MLKIRTFFLSLACTPLIIFSLHLTNQVQANSPSKGQAGSASGGAISPSNNHPGQSPSRGQAGSASGGATPPSNNHPGQSPSKGQAGSASGGGNTNNPGQSPSKGQGGSASGGGNTNNPGQSPSKGQGGSASGGGNTNNPGQSPSKGQGGSASGGGNTNNPGQSPSKGEAGSASGSESSGIIIIRKPDGSILIKLSPAVVHKLNAAANRILASGGGHRFSSAQAHKVMITLTLRGVSPKLSQAFSRAVVNIFTFSRTSTTPSFPSVQLPQGQLVASTKAFKPSSSIAEGDAVPTVNIDNLNEAINIYNKIVLESDPATLQKLSQYSDFVEIGKTLTELRAAIK